VLRPDGELAASERVDVGPAAVPFGGRLSALLDAARCAIASRRTGAARGGGGGGGAGRGGEGGETAEEEELRAEEEAELVRRWVLLSLSESAASAEGVVDESVADVAAVAEAEEAEAAAAAAEEDDVLTAAVAGNADLLERARRESADVRAWLRWMAADAAAASASETDRAAAAGLEEAAEALARRATGWDDLRREADTRADAAGGPPPAARALLVERLRGLFDPAAVLRGLYDALLAPLAAALPPPGAALLIVPDLELFVVPWAALTDRADRPLVSLYSIRLAPSLAASAAARARPSPTAGAAPSERLVVGDPWPLGAGGFKQLPQALEEARAVADLLEVPPLTAGRATRRAVVERLGGARLAHLACHGWLERRALLLAVRPRPAPPRPPGCSGRRRAPLSACCAPDRKVRVSPAVRCSRRQGMMSLPTR
jgi:hypothetical protein